MFFKALAISAAVTIGATPSNSSAQSSAPNFDIVGLRLGANPQDAAAALRAHNPAAQTALAREITVRTNRKGIALTYIPFVQLQTKAYDDNVNAWFFPATTKNDVVAITRSVRFDGQRQTIEAFKAALIAKYGAPHTEGPVREFHWYFGKDGKPTEPHRGPMNPCANANPGTMPSSAGQWWNPALLNVARLCNAATYLLVSYSQLDGLVISADFALIDIERYGTIEHSYQKTLDEAEERDAQLERDRAKGAPPPKL